jgi:hypothetical protein
MYEEMLVLLILCFVLFFNSNERKMSLQLYERRMLLQLNERRMVLP